jgi:acetyl esterase/lipase
MDRGVATRLVKEGFAVFSIDYRFAPIHPHPAQIDDCVAALQFVRSRASEYRIDPKRFGAWGASAGAHLAALLATRDEVADSKSPDPLRRESTRLSCVVAYFGPMSLAKVPGAGGAQRLVDDFMGAAADADAFRAASPIAHVSADDPPFLLVHGTNDTLVPIRQSEVFLEALRKSSVACDLVRVDGGGHGDFAIRDPDGEHWKRSVAFFGAHLGVPEKKAR